MDERLQYILKFIICIDYSVENKILFFLNSLFLNSCSLKYYRQRGAAAATASRVTHLPVLYCDQNEFNQSNVLYHSLHSEIKVYNPCHTLYDPPRTSARLPLYRQDDTGVPL